MSNPTTYLMREVTPPDTQTAEFKAVENDLDAWSRLYTERSEPVGEPRKIKRKPVGWGHLYYGDGTEPCHACNQPVGKPHLEGCDHEACPMCAEEGHDIQLGCSGQHDIASIEVELSGKIGGKRAKVTGLGFDEAGAKADADAKWTKKRERYLTRYLEDAYRKLALAEERGLTGHVAGWERNIEAAEGQLAELKREKAAA